MSNWFQENPTTTIIGHTILVATTTWFVSSFVIDENKVNLYKAQSENANAQIKTEQSTTEQYKAKVSVLEAEIENLKATNKKYLSWLEEEKHSFPVLEKKIINLEKELQSAKSNTIHEKNETSKSNAKFDIEPYSFRETLSKGSSFIDPKTSATLGVADITSDYRATGTLNIIGQETKELHRISPGTTWVFEQDNKTYKLTLEFVNWLSNTVTVSIVDISNLNLSPQK